MSKILENLEVAKDFLQTAVENTVTAVESAHSAIADASYKVAQQGVGDNEKLQSLKQKHDDTASQVYGAIREVNRSLGQLASDFFEAAEDGVHASQTMAENRESKKQD